MPDTVYVLTAADVEVLRDMARAYRNRRINTRREGADDIDHQEMLGVSIYAARTPAGGIPGADFGITGTASGSLSDNVVGSADCDIYRVVRLRGGLDGTGTGSTVPLLEPIANVSRTVYNLSTCAIEGDRYIPIMKDP